MSPSLLRSFLFVLLVVAASMPCAARAEDPSVETLDGILKNAPADEPLSVRLDGQDAETAFATTKNVEIFVVHRPAKASDLKSGMRVRLFFLGADRTAFKVEAGWPVVEGTAKSTDAIQGSITAEVNTDGGVGLDVLLPAANDARVTLDTIPAGLADVEAGRKVRLELSADKKSVVGIDVAGDPDDVFGTVKDADVAKETVVVTVGLAGREEERRANLSFLVAAGAKVRLAGKNAQLADLKPGMPIILRLAADRRTVSAVWAAKPPKADEAAAKD